MIESIKPMKHSLSGRLRGYFFAGILITAPIGITLYLAWILVSWFDGLVTPLLPDALNPQTYFSFALPGIGLLLVLLVLTAIGWATAGILGRLWTRFTETALARMPPLRGIYAAVKQIAETLLSTQSNTFREVVLVEYPRKQSWALGFITGETQGEVQRLTKETMVNVFLPTTPNPTSGFLLFIPKDEVMVLSMSIEDGIKMVVSGGIITPAELGESASSLTSY